MGAKVSSSEDRVCRRYHNATICSNETYSIESVTRLSIENQFLCEYTWNALPSIYIAKPSLPFNPSTKPANVYFRHNANGYSVDLYSGDTGNLLLEGVTVHALKDENTGQLTETTTNVKLMPRLGYASDSRGFSRTLGPLHGSIIGDDMEYGPERFVTNIRGWKQRPLPDEVILGDGATFMEGQDPLKLAKTGPHQWFDCVDCTSYTTTGPITFSLSAGEIFDTKNRTYEIGGTDKPALNTEYFSDAYSSTTAYRNNPHTVVYFPEGTPANPSSLGIFATLTAGADVQWTEIADVGCPGENDEIVSASVLTSLDEAKAYAEQRGFASFELVNKNSYQFSTTCTPERVTPAPGLKYYHASTVHSGLFVFRQDPPVLTNGVLVWPAPIVPGDPITSAGNLVTEPGGFIPDLSQSHDLFIPGSNPFCQNLAGSWIVLTVNLVRYANNYVSITDTAMELVP